MSFMDGVPVKISEKYKPPPEITIPQAIVNRLNTPENYLDAPQFNYDFTLEKCVVAKIDEWKRVRQTERENRRERIRKYELEKVRALEEKEKQLLTAVSYPNAEELSSDEDELESEVLKNGASGGLEHQGVQTASSQLSFDTILMPTVVPNSLKSPPAIFPAANSTKFNYSDWENIESSPFDNIELKTINDLDILAQVLNVTQIHSNSNNKTNPDDEKSDENNSNSAPQPEPPNSVIPPATVANFNLPPPPVVTQHEHHPQQQQQQQIVQNYTDYYNYNNLPLTNQNFLYHSYMYQQQDQSQPQVPQISYNHYTSNYSNGLNYQRCTAAAVDPIDETAAGTESDAIAKSKSKSVPDILKELNSEIRDSEARRARNHSQTLDDHKEKITEEPNSSPHHRHHHHHHKSKPKNPESFTKLSPSSQKLVKSISSMGFPLERVSKIVELLGNDDKKIVEHLIPLSELLDLGFEETKISEALLKFDNNKEKALDFLIS